MLKYCRLPFPWLLFTLINQQDVTVSSYGLGCFILLLFLMLLAVFICIVIFNWKMTKIMGAMMMVLYAVFVVVAVAFSNKWIKCPI